MARANLRIRVDERGGLEVIDPGFDTLPLMREIDPTFRVKAARLPNYTMPRFQQLRACSTGLSKHEADALCVDQLWSAHDASMAMLNSGSLAPVSKEVSLLQLKFLIAARLLAACRLCARLCMVDRTGGETGPCGLGTQAFVAEHFVHIAEEAPLNPSLVLNLRGCALRCKFCQQHALLGVREPGGERLNASLWKSLSLEGARSMSFIGGNPDESMHAILQFLNSAPEQWELPIVWNNHAYMSDEGIRLLEGVVDCYVPDLKYFDPKCGLRLSGVTHYPLTAKATIRALLHEGVPVIVRILVLPGHSTCCHIPSLRWLAKQGHQGNLSVSVRGQYSPDWKITGRDGLLARRVTHDEVEAVVKIAHEFGLQLTY